MNAHATSLAGAAALLLSFQTLAEQTSGRAPFGADFMDAVIPLSLQATTARTACVTLMPGDNSVLQSDSRLSDLALALTQESLGESRPTSRYEDLWARLRAGFALPSRKSRLVAQHEAWYLKHSAHLQRTMERGRRYLYFITEELEKRGMPTEIALLPIVESAYSPHAYSRMGAAGMWQFIPGTGRRYGLEQNYWYDGRRDVVAATHAALDYLQFLHDLFGDWELALAAYNWGEGAVRRAIAYNRARHRPTSYASLNMPKETRNYVPRLLAVRNVISNARSLGLELEPIPNRPYFAVIKSPGNIEVLKAAQLANMPIEEFRSLNPGYNRPVMLQGVLQQIVLPVDNVDRFHANLASNADPLVTWQLYKLKRGDTLKKVATQFGVNLDRLREVNGIGSRKRIRAGHIVVVPSVRERSVAP